MGYGLNAFLDHDEPLDILVRLMVGSEGTLGFVVSAVFRTVEVLPAAATGLLVFDDVESATAAVPQVVGGGRRHRRAAGRRVAAGAPDAACPSSPPAVIRELDVDGHAALLVELQASTEQELGDRRRIAELVPSRRWRSAPFGLTTDAAERAALWHIRKGLYSAVARARPERDQRAAGGRRRAGATGSASLRRGLTGLFDDPRLRGVGHLRPRPGRQPALPAQRAVRRRRPCCARYEAFTTDMVDLVLGLDGTLKAEHGTGRIMAPFVRAAVRRRAVPR